MRNILSDFPEFGVLSSGIRQSSIMKTIKHLLVIVLAVASLVPAITVSAADKKPEVRPYKLETCIVTDEKLGEMGKPVVFEYKGQEYKLCCKGCRKDFDKEPAKFAKK